jgi:Tol biopolymer transport system component
MSGGSMIGERIGPYEISGPLGAGGMGKVWRAKDSRLRREVAIKVLPATLTADGERLARFEREARTLAALNHPNIAVIYGLEETGGTRALVMELVEGEDLAARMARGPLPLEEALPIARQIAAALEAAHEQGIVHRDLKPANAKVRADGTVKVLDFGLAKVMEAISGAVASADLADSPTVTGAHGTQPGVILGTAAYMAPEQARGGIVDKRADLWAFGVVLFEMLTGRSLFAGETVSDTIAAVLKSDIDLAALPVATPRAIRELLRRCLERDPKNRLRDAGDARLVLDDALAGRADRAEPPPVAAPPAPHRLGRWLPWAIAAVAAAVAIAAVWRPPRATPANAPSAIRFQLQLPDSVSSTRRGSFFTLSPDGRHLAIAVDGRLWVRPLDAVEARRIEGADDVTYPFWSPDGAWIGFFSGGQIRRVARDGGPPQRLCDAPEGRGAAWSPDGVIVFSPYLGVRGLWRVSGQGGQPVQVTSLPEKALTQGHRYPQFLPDGRFLYMHLAPDPAVAGNWVAALEGGPPVRVLDGANQAVYVPSASDPARGHLLYRRERTLLAQPFDLASLRATGEAQPVAQGVGTGANSGAGAFTASANGVLAFTSDFEDNGELVWVDRAGKRLEVLSARTAELQGLALAAGDGGVAYGTGRPSDVWVQPLPGGEPSRFTFGPDPGWAYPLWSPDASQLTFATWDLVGVPHYEIRRRRVDRGGSDETLLRSPTPVYPWDWSPDGTTLVYSDLSGALRLLPLAGARQPVRYREATGDQGAAQFSPDGSLLTFASNEQGRTEVFVGTVPASDAVWQLSTGGGSMPRWRRDGRELFFRDGEGMLVAVPLGPGTGAAAIDGRGAPQRLFAGIPTAGNKPVATYAVGDGGERFLIASMRSADQPPIAVVVHWQAALTGAGDAR